VRASRPEVPPRRMRVRTAQRPAELLADAHACVPQHSSPLCTFHEAVALMQARRRNAINVAGEATGSVTLPQPRVHKTCRLRLDNGCGEGLPRVKRRANGRFWEISINAECVCCSARRAKRGPGDASRSRQLARAPCVSRGRARLLYRVPNPGGRAAQRARAMQTTLIGGRCDKAGCRGHLRDGSVGTSKGAALRAVRYARKSERFQPTTCLDVAHGRDMLRSDVGRNRSAQPMPT
jgi:hypothetical protein